MIQRQESDALVIGSTGTVAVKVIEELLKRGYRVHAVTTNRSRSRGLEEYFSEAFVNGNILYYRNVNVYDIGEFLAFEEQFRAAHCENISCVVFCLALGPQSGFMESAPLDIRNISEGMWNGVVEQYVHFFSRVTAFLAPLFHETCDIVFVTSGIADLESDACPLWLTPSLYQIGKERLDSFIKYIRNSEIKVPKKQVCFHRIGISSHVYFMGQLISSTKISSYHFVMEGITKALEEVISSETEVDYDFVSQYNPALVSE